MERKTSFSKRSPIVHNASSNHAPTCFTQSLRKGQESAKRGSPLLAVQIAISKLFAWVLGTKRERRGASTACITFKLLMGIIIKIEYSFAIFTSILVEVRSEVMANLSSMFLRTSGWFHYILSLLRQSVFRSTSQPNSNNWVISTRRYQKYILLLRWR